MTLIPAYHTSGTGNLPPTRLVIHATCPGLGYPQASADGQALATARYFQQPTSGGSAHHVADIGRTVRCATDDTVCWHAPPNLHSIGYEVCGEASYTRDQWLSPQVWPAVERTAAQVAADAATYGIPLVRLSPADLLAGKHGICGHVDVTEAWHQSDHTDPGPDFPWDRFMALLAAHSPTEDTVTPDDIEKIADRVVEKLGIPGGFTLYGALIRLGAWLAGHGDNALYNPASTGGPAPKENP